MRSFLYLLVGCSLMPLGAVACGSADEGGAQSGDPSEVTPGEIAAHTDPLVWRARPRPRPVPGTPGTGGTSGNPAPSSGGASSGSIDSIIAAAQTPDGRAIPQPSLPGGQCPAVVVALGFWSCPTIGDACTFQSGGVTHHCACSRVDGEGQSPAWVCN